MKILFLNCNICNGILNYLTSLLSKLLCFINKQNRKSSLTSPQDAVPFSIQIQGGKNNITEIPLVDWNKWDDNEENEKPLEDNIAEELFKDMEPVINKAKVVHVKKKLISKQVSDPFAFNRSTRIGSDSSTKYQVNNELGVWEDNERHNDGWVDEDFNDFDINQQTESMLKYNKQSEREKRSQEQLLKKIEKEKLRATKKQDTKLAVKIS